MMREQNRKKEACVQEMRTGYVAGKGASAMEDGTGDVLRSPATESTGAEMAGAQHMAVRDVMAGYHGKVVLDGLCFEVPRGGILVLIGPAKAVTVADRILESRMRIVRKRRTSTPRERA